MRANLPKEYRNSGSARARAALKQAQDIQKDIEKACEELKVKEYSASVGGGALSVVSSGDMKVKSIDAAPEVIGEMFEETFDKFQKIFSEKMKEKSVNIAPEIVEEMFKSARQEAFKSLDCTMLFDLIISGVNESITAARVEKEETIEKLSGAVDISSMLGGI